MWATGNSLQKTESCEGGRRVQRVEFLFVVTLLVEQSFGYCHRLGKGCLYRLGLPGKPAFNVSIHPPQHRSELRGGAVRYS